MNELNKLQQFRKEKGLTQQELSTLSGIQLNTIKALEIGTPRYLPRETCAV